MEGLVHSPRQKAIHLAALISAVVLICLGLLIFVIEIAQGNPPLLGTLCLFLYLLNFFGLIRPQRWLNLLALLGAGFCIIFSLLLITAYLRNAVEVSRDTLWTILLYALLHSFCFYELLHRFREARAHAAKG